MLPRMILNNSSKGIANQIEKQFNLGMRERMKYMFSSPAFSVLIYLSFLSRTKEIQFLNFFK